MKSDLATFEVRYMNVIVHFNTVHFSLTLSIHIILQIAMYNSINY